MIKESCSKQIIHILIFVSRRWGRAREGAGLEVTTRRKIREEGSEFCRVERETHPRDSVERNGVMLTTEEV